MVARRTRSSAASEPHQLSSPPATPASNSKRATRTRGHAAPPKVKEEPPVTPARKRKRASSLAEDESAANELPHNLDSVPTPGGDDGDIKKEDASPPSRKRTRKAIKTEDIKLEDETAHSLARKAEAVASSDGEIEAPQKGKKPKKANYGLSPGETPYPDWPHPTPEECHEVVRLLEKVHGKIKAPATIPLPSLTVSGCGEVPSVLDALIRTRLSAATTGTNSSRAFQGLVKTFGTIQSGVGKGSVDWNKVRLAPQKEVFEAIKSGGLADVKSRDIKSILQMVWEENQERGKALKDDTGAQGAENEPQQEKNEEVARADENVLSLDHLHLLSNDDAFNHMIRYPGIGPKTASCVLLFCLQRPSFAVDTHVFRLCRYLGWVPPYSKVKKGQPKVERNSTYAHCEVRIPDKLKYALHQLLIKHGKSCPRCRAATGMGSEGWSKGCPIEHLVTRHGAKKGALGGAGKKVGVRRGKKADTEESEESESELSDLDDDEE